MATAVQPTAPRASALPRTQLVFASIFGAIVVLTGIAAAAHFVPLAWDQYVAPVLAPLGSFMISFLRVIAQAATVGLFVALGSALAGQNPPHGLRGGIFLVISAAITVFFVVRAVGLNLEQSSLEGWAMPITFIVLGALLGLMFRLLASERGTNLMKAIDDQGFLHTFNYKRTQGLRARRYTLLGILLIGLSGVYSAVDHNMLTGSWQLRMPFTGPENRFLPVLTDLAYTGPILLCAATFWLGWRLVNAPTFADFLIATEAEMNKVAWSSRKRLFQDTIVVLTTVLLMTLFFLVVDFFWGWFLSREMVGVLPARTETSDVRKVDAVRGRIVDW